MLKKYKVTKARVIRGWAYQAGDLISLPEPAGKILVARGWVEPAEIKPTGPSEIKPVAPTELKEAKPAEAEGDAELEPSPVPEKTQDKEQRKSEIDHVNQVAALSVDDVLTKVKSGEWNAKAVLAAEECGKNRISLLRELRKLVR